MITKRQQEILDFMLLYQEEHRDPQPPTLVEIAEAVGLKSKGVVFWHMSKLVESGAVEVRPGATQRKYIAIEVPDGTSVVEAG